MEITDLEFAKYKWMEVEDLNLEERVMRYIWLVQGLRKCLDIWDCLMFERNKYGACKGWEPCEHQGEGLIELMDEMVLLACEIDPEAVAFWHQMKNMFTDIKLRYCEILRTIDIIPDDFDA